MSAKDALEKLCKWRGVLAGWHLGTQAKSAPGVQAMRDLRELTLLMRAEVSALVTILIEKNVFTVAEFDQQIEAEAKYLDAAMERKFPGYATTDEGVVIDPKTAIETNKRLGFPD